MRGLVLFSNNKKRGYQIINPGPLTGRQFRTTSRGKSSRNCPDFNESRCAGCEPPSVRGNRGCLARPDTSNPLQIHQARAWETLPGIFRRFEKQGEGEKFFLKLKEASNSCCPRESWGHMRVHKPTSGPHALDPPPGSERRPSPGLSGPRPPHGHPARARGVPITPGHPLHLPPGRCHSPSLLRGRDFLERCGRVGTWRAGSGVMRGPSPRLGDRAPTSY